MHTCSNCKIEKTLDCFAKSATKKRGHNTWCKECSKSASKKHYLKNRDDRIKDARERKMVQKRKLKEFLVSLSLKCTNCGESEYACLDFHHLDPTIKEKEISSIVWSGGSMRSLLNEMEKCIVLCSNCHRKYHAGLIELTHTGYDPVSPP